MTTTTLATRAVLFDQDLNRRNIYSDVHARPLAAAPGLPGRVNGGAARLGHGGLIIASGRSRRTEAGRVAAQLRDTARDLGAERIDASYGTA